MLVTARRVARPNAALRGRSRAGHDVALHEPDAIAMAIADFMQHGIATPSAR